MSIALCKSNFKCAYQAHAFVCILLSIVFKEFVELVFFSYNYSYLRHPFQGTVFDRANLVVAGETFIPYYQGKVIDTLRGQYQHNSFMYAIGGMGLVSLGRYTGFASSFTFSSFSFGCFLSSVFCIYL